MPATPVRIDSPRASDRHATSRVEASVDGHPVWFESTDARLVPAPEAWASAFMIPGLRLGRPLAMEAAVDATWAANAVRLVRQVRRDWGYGHRAMRFLKATPPAAAPAGERSRGLFFTGGVDSFHGLLCSDEHPDVLVNVHGFDIPLDDDARQNVARVSIERVAAATGTRALFLRTNLRLHPLIREAPWDAIHGGALAAVGHVLSGVLRRIAIGSSQPRWSTNPWGSNWRTDPLWSGTAIEFVHLDPDIDRLQKIRRIAAYPLVQEHLRVCWSETGPRANCSRCEKCMLTMLGLAEAGVLQHSAAFEKVDLLDLVRRRRRSRWRLPMLHELASSRRFDPEMRQALRAMWWRSVLWRSTGVRWSVRLARRVLGLARPHPTA